MIGTIILILFLGILWGGITALIITEFFKGKKIPVLIGLVITFLVIISIRHF